MSHSFGISKKIIVRHCTSLNNDCITMIGTSVSEPHACELNACRHFSDIVLVCRTLIRMFLML